MATSWPLLRVGVLDLQCASGLTAKTRKKLPDEDSLILRSLKQFHRQYVLADQLGTLTLTDIFT